MRVSIKLLLMCFSVYMFYLSGQIVLNDIGVLRFESTEGRIISSNIGSESAIFDEPTMGAVTAMVYYPIIKYDYRVGGKIFVSDRYRITLIKIGNMNTVQEVIEKYPVGMRVSVWYDPNDPAFAVISKRISLIPHVILFT